MTVSISNLYNLRTSNFKANDVADAQDAALTVTLGGTTAGTSTAYTATPTPAWTSYATKDILVIIPHATNTGATTVNVSSLGTKNVFFLNAACRGGELPIGVPVMLQYDGTQFQVVTHGLPSWNTWTPTYAAIGTTFSINTTLIARHLTIGKTFMWQVGGFGTTSGVATTAITISLPASHTVADSDAVGYGFIGASPLNSGHAYFNTSTTLAIRKNDNSNLPTSTPNYYFFSFGITDIA